MTIRSNGMLLKLLARFAFVEFSICPSFFVLSLNGVNCQRLPSGVSILTALNKCHLCATHLFTNAPIWSATLEVKKTVLW